jgi:transcriptional regulator with XRE-family HTH domain
MQEEKKATTRLASVFRDTLVRTMRVAGEDVSGNPAAISQTDLEERTGVSRKVIGEYCSGNGDGAKLETIERLADGLGVPAAFLLMRREDWISLANAVTTLMAISCASGEDSAPHKQSIKDSLSPIEAAEIGVALARALGTIPKRRGDLLPELAKAIRAAEKGVAHTAAAPPYHTLTTDQKYAAIALCAFAGTPKHN